MAPGLDADAPAAPGHSTKFVQLRKHLRSKWFWGSLIVILLFFIVMISVRLNMQWFWLLLYAVITVPFAPFIRSPIKFFRYISLRTHCPECHRPPKDRTRDVLI